MPTYTFRGRDMTEAVEQVRVMLGSDAVIIDTLRGTDHIGRFVEITATGELKSAPAESPAVAQHHSTRSRDPRSRDPRTQADGRGAAPLPLPRGRRTSPRGGSIDAPSRREYDPSGSGRPAPRGRQRGEAVAPPARAQGTGYHSIDSSHGGGLPGDLGLLQDPPREVAKGAERYVHPNSFSTQREPIIPRPAPTPQGQPRGTRPVHPHARAYQQAAEPRPLHSVTPPHRGERAQRQPHPAAHPPPHPAQRRQTGSQQYVADGYNPRGIDPWGLEQQESPASRSAASVQGHLGHSVEAVRDALVQTDGGEAVQFVTERLNEILSYIQAGQTGTGGIPAPVFEHLRQFQQQLEATGIKSEYAADLIEQTKGRVRLNQLDKQVILANLGQVLAQNLSCINPLDIPFGMTKNVLAFVGPTGVGKTTTIAKIAAHAQLTHEMPVTLISTDTFRMAAVEQLSRYASILDCPAEAAHSAEELWQKIDAAKTPLVLVDTTGRNPKTHGQLKGLFDLFGEGWTGRTVLTLAANTREQDLKPIVEGFSPLKYNMVAVTKLDETYALGTVFNVGKLTNCPISWTTHGQRVPEDIELANSELLAVKIIMEAIAHKV